MRKWVFLILILLLVIALVLLALSWLRPNAAAWCCMRAGAACEGVSAYQECAARGGKVFHADSTTCNTLCSLVPLE